MTNAIFYYGLCYWLSIYQIDVSFSSVCPVIDHEFCHNIVKVAVLQVQSDMTILSAVFSHFYLIFSIHIVVQRSEL